MWFESKGILRYTYNWLFIDCDEGIGRFYRELYKLSVWKTKKLNRPEAKEHITVISKYERPLIKSNWEFRNGEEVSFSYNIDAIVDDVYVWMTVTCYEAQQIRESYGLGEPYWPFHLTLGNFKR